MAKPVIRAILSDWGKVVVHFDNRIAAQAFVEYSLLAGPSEELLHARLFVDCRELFELYMRGLVSTSLFRLLVRNVLRLSKDCTDTAFDAAFSDIFELNMPMVTFQQQLRMRGVRLVATSNVEEIRHRHLQGMGLDDLFDELNLSYREKVGKPEPEFLMRALAKAGVPAQQVLFIDDHAEFTAVGESIGMRTWTYAADRHPAFLDFANNLDFQPA